MPDLQMLDLHEMLPVPMDFAVARNVEESPGKTSKHSSGQWFDGEETQIRKLGTLDTLTSLCRDRHNRPRAKTFEQVLWVRDVVDEEHCSSKSCQKNEETDKSVILNTERTDERAKQKNKEADKSLVIEEEKETDKRANQKNEKTKKNGIQKRQCDEVGAKENRDADSSKAPCETSNMQLADRGTLWTAKDLQSLRYLWPVELLIRSVQLLFILKPQGRKQKRFEQPHEMEPYQKGPSTNVSTVIATWKAPMDRCRGPAIEETVEGCVCVPPTKKFLPETTAVKDKDRSKSVKSGPSSRNFRTVKRVLIETSTADGETSPTETTIADREKIPTETSTTDREKIPTETSTTDREKIPTETTTADREKIPTETTTADREKIPTETSTTDGETSTTETSTTGGETSPSETSETTSSTSNDTSSTTNSSTRPQQQSFVAGTSKTSSGASGIGSQGSNGGEDEDDDDKKGFRRRPLDKDEYADSSQSVKKKKNHREDSQEKLWLSLSVPRKNTSQCLKIGPHEGLAHRGQGDSNGNYCEEVDELELLGELKQQREGGMRRGCTNLPLGLEHLTDIEDSVRLESIREDLLPARTESDVLQQVLLCMMAIASAQVSKSCELCCWLQNLLRHFDRCSKVSDCHRCLDSAIVIVMHVQNCGGTLHRQSSVDEVRQALHGLTPMLMLHNDFRRLRLGEGPLKPLSLPTRGKQKTVENTRTVNSLPSVGSDFQEESDESVRLSPGGEGARLKTFETMQHEDDVDNASWGLGEDVRPKQLRNGATAKQHQPPCTPSRADQHVFIDRGNRGHDPSSVSVTPRNCSVAPSNRSIVPGNHSIDPSNRSVGPRNISLNTNSGHLKSLVDPNQLPRRERAVLESGEVRYGSVDDVQFFLEALRKFAQEDSDHRWDARTEGIIYNQHSKLLVIMMGQYRETEEWQVVASLGGGMFGKCYAAQDERSEKSFCVKKVPINRMNPDECVLLSRLSCPHIMGCYGALRCGDQVYFLFELLTGDSMKEFVSLGPLPLDQALGFLRQLMLAQLHHQEHGVIHGDLKPENMMVRDGEEDCLVLVDYGMVRQVHAPDYTIPEGENPKGSCPEMSPEKARSEAHGYPSEIWAHACNMLFKLNGVEPFVSKFTNQIRLIMQIGKEPESILEEIPRELPEPVQDLLRGMLAARPHDRLTAHQVLSHPAFDLLVSLPPLHSIMLGHLPTDMQDYYRQEREGVNAEAVTEGSASLSQQHGPASVSNQQEGSPSLFNQRGPASPAMNPPDVTEAGDHAGRREHEEENNASIIPLSVDEETEPLDDIIVRGKPVQLVPNASTALRPHAIDIDAFLQNFEQDEAAAEGEEGHSQRMRRNKPRTDEARERENSVLGCRSGRSIPVAVAMVCATTSSSGTIIDSGETDAHAIERGRGDTDGSAETLCHLGDSDHRDQVAQTNRGAFDLDASLYALPSIEDTEESSRDVGALDQAAETSPAADARDEKAMRAMSRGPSSAFDLDASQFAFTGDEQERVTCSSADFALGPISLSENDRTNEKLRHAVSRDSSAPFDLDSSPFAAPDEGVPEGYVSAPSSGHTSSGFNRKDNSRMSQLHSRDSSAIDLDESGLMEPYLSQYDDVEGAAAAASSNPGNNTHSTPIRPTDQDNVMRTAIRHSRSAPFNLDDSEFALRSTAEEKERAEAEASGTFRWETEKTGSEAMPEPADFLDGGSSAASVLERPGRKLEKERSKPGMRVQDQKGLKVEDDDDEDEDLYNAPDGPDGPDAGENGNTSSAIEESSHAAAPRRGISYEGPPKRKVTLKRADSTEVRSLQVAPSSHYEDVIRNLADPIEGYHEWTGLDEEGRALDLSQEVPHRPHVIITVMERDESSDWWVAESCIQYSADFGGTFMGPALNDV